MVSSVKQHHAELHTHLQQFVDAHIHDIDHGLFTPLVNRLVEVLWYTKSVHKRNKIATDIIAILNNQEVSHQTKIDEIAKIIDEHTTNTIEQKKEYDETMKKAEDVLGKEIFSTLSLAQKEAIRLAHIIGDGEIGADGKTIGVDTVGIHSDGTTNYTLHQLGRKLALLEQAWFDGAIRKLLVERGVCGITNFIPAWLRNVVNSMSWYPGLNPKESMGKKLDKWVVYNLWRLSRDNESWWVSQQVLDLAGEKITLFRANDYDGTLCILWPNWRFVTMQRREESAIHLWRDYQYNALWFTSNVSSQHIKIEFTYDSKVLITDLSDTWTWYGEKTNDNEKSEVMSESRITEAIWSCTSFDQLFASLKKYSPLTNSHGDALSYDHLEKYINYYISQYPHGESLSQARAGLTSKYGLIDKIQSLCSKKNVDFNEIHDFQQLFTVLYNLWWVQWSQTYYKAPDLIKIIQSIKQNTEQGTPLSNEIYQITNTWWLRDQVVRLLNSLDIRNDALMNTLRPNGFFDTVWQWAVWNCYSITSNQLIKEHPKARELLNRTIKQWRTPDEYEVTLRWKFAGRREEWSVYVNKKDIDYTKQLKKWQLGDYILERAYASFRNMIYKWVHISKWMSLTGMTLRYVQPNGALVHEGGYWYEVFEAFFWQNAKITPFITNGANANTLLQPLVNWKKIYLGSLQWDNDTQSYYINDINGTAVKLYKSHAYYISWYDTNVSPALIEVVNPHDTWTKRFWITIDQALQSFSWWTIIDLQ